MQYIWHNVDEELPDQSGDYLILYGYPENTHMAEWLYPEVRYYDGHKFYLDGYAGNRVSWWAELPLPPDGVDQHSWYKV